MNFDLPELVFCEHDAEKIEAELVSNYERAVNAPLSPASPIRLFLKTIAAALFRQRYLIDFAAKQNVLAYAKGDFLDHIGVLVGVKRLEASQAKATLRLYKEGVDAVIVPAGSRFTADGKVFFRLEKETIIPSDSDFVDAICVSLKSGIDGNGFVIGQIKKIVDPAAGLKSAENITQSAGGAEPEDDGAFRERIWKNVGAFSKCGPKQAYKAHAVNAHPAIADVQVVSPSPGVVNLYPICKDGSLPTPEILAAVEEKCSADTVRPLTDFVRALAPEIVEYEIELTYFIAANSAKYSSLTAENVVSAVTDFKQWQETAMGRDINPDRLLAGVVNAGAKRAEITAPKYRVLQPTEIARAKKVTVHFGGIEED